MSQSVLNCTAPDGGQTSLEHLQHEARRLWGGEPHVGSAHRPTLLRELTDVDLALERLALRAAATPLDGDDRLALDECRNRLGRLRRHWRPHH